MSNRQRQIFERSWLPVDILLLVVALATQAALLLVGVLAILAIGVLAQSWRRFGLHQVAYQRQFSEQRLFPGEQTVLRMQLINRKLLPLPWLGISEEFSSGLRPVHDSERHSSVRRFAVRQSFTLGPFERVERDLPLMAVRRGCYVFSAVAATAGDPFGLYRADGMLGSREEVLVYPAFLEDWQYQVTAQQPFGEVGTSRPVWLDPTRPAGVRDYVSGDPLRQLHWRATARLGRLQTRRYDPSAAVQLMIVLDVNTSEQSWRGVDHAVLEHAISVAASIARDAIAQRLPVGLLANALSVNSDQTIRVPPGRSPDQLAAILEELARLVLYFGLPIGQLLERVLPGLPVGASVVLVSALDSPDTDAALDMLRRRGHPTYRCDPREQDEALEGEVAACAP